MVVIPANLDGVESEIGDKPCLHHGVKHSPNATL